MGGPTVDSGAVQQQQQNQQQAQQYAAQQQQAALAAVNGWLGQNKAPSATAAPLQPPGAASPATMGGGNFAAGKVPGQVASKGGAPGGPPASPSPQPAAPAAGGAVAPPGGMSPQIRQAIIAALSAQGAK